MPSLFTLFVDLKANTADFVSGMSTASYAAKKAGRDIEESFSSLGSIATAALAPFGELGAVIGETLGKVGEYATRASEQFAHLGGGMSAVTVAGGLAAGAMAAVGVGAVGLAVETAKTVDEMYHLAESSGVSVEALSKLSFVAKQYDIDQETLAKGLQMMAVQMEKAATQGPNVISVFQRMGLSVRDSNGQLKDASTMFTEIIGKLQQMQDRTAAVGLARQIFGRQTGAAVLRIPGSEAIDKWGAEAQKLNLVIDEQTAQAAHHFEESLNVIKGAAQGVSLQLEAQMLPVLQAVTNAMVNFAESSNRSAGPIAGLVDELKYFLQITDFVITELQLVGSWIAKTAVAWQVFGAGAKEAIKDSLEGDYEGATAAWKNTFDQLNAVQKDYLDRGKENWKDYQDFIGTLFAKPTATKPEEAPKIPGGEPNLSQRTMLGIPPKDAIADLVAKLAEQSSAELTLASSVQQTVAAMTLAKAAGEAEVKIAEQRNQLLDQEKTLRAELANAQAEQLPGDVAKYQQEIAVVQGYLQELDRDAPLIRQRYQEIAAAKLFSSTGEDLGKQTEKFDAQIASLNELAAAYKQGGSAIAAADVSKQIETARQKVADLAEAYARFAAENPFDLPALAQLGEGLANADVQLQKLAADAEALKRAEIETEIQKQTRAFNDQLPALGQLANAYLKGADAVREAQVQMKVAEFKSANPSASAEQIKEITALYQEQSNVAYQGAIAQEAAHYNISQSYSDEIEKLNQVREALQGIGASTLAVDAAIDDANTKAIEQWDKMAFQVGSLTDKYHAVFNEIEQQGDSFAEKISSSMSKAVDDISGQLAELVVTGRSSFTKMFEGLAEQAAKAGFEQIFAKIAAPFTGGAPGTNQVGPGGTAGTFQGSLGIGQSIAGIFGLKAPHGAAPDGSQANPFYTVPVDSQGGLLGKNVGSASIIGSLFGAQSNSQDNPLYTPALYDQPGSSGGFGLGSIGSAISTVGKSIGSIFGSIGSFFGGFLATGGDVTPGKAYVVGEKHPEFFIPRQSGHVAPSLKMQQGNTIVQTFQINGVADADSFQRSHAQIAARWHRETQLAFQRNG